MARRFECAYLGGSVECTAERERHIRESHPELADDLEVTMAATLAEPDTVRRSRRSASARLLSKWYKDRWGGKHVVVVVVTDAHASPVRHWIVTAYVTARIPDIGVEWNQN